VTNVAEKLGGGLNIVRLTRRDHHLDGQAILVGQSMDFRRKTAPASSKTSILVAFLKRR
jgi:hypothetical protein